MKLSYSLTPGDSHTYEVEIDQLIEMTAEGDAAALGDEEDLPGALSINLTGTTTFTYAVAEGPEPGTYAVTITGNFTDLDMAGTIDGASVEETEIPDFTELDPIDVTVIVDEQGNIIPSDDEFGDLFSGGLGAFEDLTGSGSTPGRFIGPPFPDDEVSVGDTWTETIELPGMLTDEAVTTEITSEVTGTDTIDGNDVFVIDTRSVTGMVEFDLAELLLGFFLAFAPDEGSAEEQAELDALAESLRFLIAIDETVSDMTTWFDAEAGQAVQADFSSLTRFVMDLNMPDDETGEMIGFVLDMTLDQDVTYRLVDSDGA